jgi:hypothetical protein
MTVSDSFTSNSSSGRDGRVFSVKIFAFVAIFLIVADLGSILFDRKVNWRAHQDPHQRLLWDQRTDQADVILLGDSVFASEYVNSPKQSFTNLVQESTGARVFNGALDGAEPIDFLQSARLLVENGTRQEIVILDVMPNRFLTFKRPDSPEGNYPGRFSRLVARDPVRKVVVYLSRKLIILERDILMGCVIRKSGYGVEPFRDRVWMRDGDLAARRFQVFQMLIGSDVIRPFDWIAQLRDIVQAGDNNLVIFVSPVNNSLIDTYASPQNAERYHRLYLTERQKLLTYLQEQQIPYIDANGRVDSESFVDLVHVNARGNRQFADLISNYLHSNSPSSPLAEAHEK